MFCENIAEHSPKSVFFRRNLLNLRVWSGAHVCRSCRVSKMLQKECLAVKTGFDLLKIARLQRLISVPWCNSVSKSLIFCELLSKIRKFFDETTRDSTSSLDMGSDLGKLVQYHRRWHLLIWWKSSEECCSRLELGILGKLWAQARPRRAQAVLPRDWMSFNLSTHV